MNKNQELEALYDTVAAIYLKNIQFLSKKISCFTYKNQTI